MMAQLLAYRTENQYETFITLAPVDDREGSRSALFPTVKPRPNKVQRKPKMVCKKLCSCCKCRSSDSEDDFRQATNSSRCRTQNLNHNPVKKNAPELVQSRTATIPVQYFKLNESVRGVSRSVDAARAVSARKRGVVAAKSQLVRDDVLGCELSTSSPAAATLPRRSNSPLPPHDAEDLCRLGLGVHNKSGLQARSESMASVYSGAGEGARGAVAVRGAAQFSLIYNYKLGALEVGVKRCRDLAPVDVKRNRSDPYVKVYLLPDKSKFGKRKTKVKKNTLNPMFEESLKFVQPLDALLTRTLWLSVWSSDMFGRNDFLGEVMLPLADMVFDDTSPKWYPLQERTEQFEEQQGSKGDVILGLKFETCEGSGARAKGTLHVLVKEAKNLVATKPNGLADAFCKSYLLPERGRLVKQKSSVVRRSLNPRWEHSFTYRGVTLQDLAQRALELSVWDKDRISSNDFMGGVRLSLGSGTYMGSPVNWLDSVGKEVTLWQTMMQRPNFWVEGSLPLRSHLSS